MLLLDMNNQTVCFYGLNGNKNPEQIYKTDLILKIINGFVLLVNLLSS